MDDKNQLIVALRMEIAARRQALRDSVAFITQEQTNEMLDQIIKLTELLNELLK